MIHVCYALHDESGKYSKFVGTSIESLLENTREEVTIHLLHDSTLTPENRKKFMSIVYRFEQEIEFYNVDNLAREHFEKMKTTCPSIYEKRHTIAALYRLLIPKILSPDIHRAIYIDGDTIVNLDLKEFESIDLQNFLIGVSPEYFSGNTLYAQNFNLCQKKIVDPKDYFNSGVMLMDLDQVRKLGGGGHI